MDPIRTHHDGHGLNELLGITCDERDPNGGGASHQYTVHYNHGPEDRQEVAFIQFQHGPRNVEGSKPGCTEAVLLAILIDRLRGFQAGPFASRQNALMLTKLEEALHWTRDRADERAQRGVLGQNLK